jgi:hypothetical protein
VVKATNVVKVINVLKVINEVKAQNKITEVGNMALDFLVENNTQVEMF